MWNTTVSEDLFEHERVAPTLDRIVTETIDLGVLVVECALQGAPVTLAELADDERHTEGCGEDRSDARDDGFDGHISTLALADLSIADLRRLRLRHPLSLQRLVRLGSFDRRSGGLASWHHPPPFGVRSRMTLIAADDGIWQGNITLADVFFLIATIVFIIAVVVRLMVRPVPIDMVLVAVGLACLALGWLVL
jgi:hypothetical protein